MSRFKGMLIAGLFVTGSLASACGQAMPELGTASLRAAGQATTTQGSPDQARPSGRQGRGGQGQPGMGAEGRGGHGPMGLFAGVALNDDQKAQLKAVMEKFRPAHKPQNDLHKLLTADTVDAAAIRAAFQAAETDRAANDKSRLAMMVEVRAIYTEAQRAEIVTKIQNAPAPKDDATTPPADMEAKRAEREAAMATKLGLTDEQKAAVAALRPTTSPAKPDRAAHQAAMIAFWQTGDTSGLQALPNLPTVNVDAIVTAATLLSAEQRKAIFNRMHGGFEGQGGRGSHGGRGFGGHGGPRPEGAPDQAIEDAAV